MSIVERRLNIYRIMLYTLLFPFTIFIIVKEFFIHIQDIRSLKEYSYGEYKQHINWVPTFRFDAANILIAMTSVFIGYLVFTFIYEFTIYKDEILIFFVVLIPFYGAIAVMNRWVIRSLIKKKHFYRLAIEQENYIDLLLEELKRTIRVSEFDDKRSNVELIVSFLELDRHDPSVIDDVMGYKNIICFQYTVIKKYYDDQMHYLEECKDRIILNIKQSIKLNENNLTDMKLDPLLMNQSNRTYELRDEFFQYITNFNLFMKRTIWSFVDINKTLNKVLLAYCIRIGALDRLNDQAYYSFLLVQFDVLSLKQIKDLIQNRSRVLSIRDSDGNALLHHSVMRCQLALTTFLLKHDIDVNLKNNKGHNALHYATKVKDEAHVELLEEHGAFIEFTIHSLVDE